MVGVAVKVTELLAHIVVVGVLMLTDGVTVGFTVIVIEFEVAVVGDAQVAFEVITQVTTEPVANVVVVYVALFVPTLVPFTFH